MAAASSSLSSRTPAIGDVADEQTYLILGRYDMRPEIRQLLTEGDLNEGEFGTVYRAENIETGRFVAVKRIMLDPDGWVPAGAASEVSLLDLLEHPHVVRLLDAVSEAGSLVLVFENYESDLKQHIQRQGFRLASAAVKEFLHQLCSGIEFCHSNRVIHRDLKPRNLLVDDSQRLKIAHFSSACAFVGPIPHTGTVVNRWYRAPELLLGSRTYSIPIDMWSVGCILAEMATGAPVFAGDSAIDVMFKIFKKRGSPTTEVWPGLSLLPDFKPTFPKWPVKCWSEIGNTLAQVGGDGVDLLEELTRFDPTVRASAQGALLHPYLAGTTV